MANPETITSRDGESVFVGTDKVAIENGTLAIYARVEMNDWHVREFRRPRVWFRDHQFQIRAKTPAPKPFAVRYELWPWPEDRHDPPGPEIHYDEDYVRQRDRHYRGEAGRELARPVALMLSPFIGFLWRGWKEPMRTVGIDIREATSLSIYLGFCLGIAMGVLTGWLGWLTVLNISLLLVFVVDSSVRYDRMNKDSDAAPGFLEWIFRRH